LPTVAKSRISEVISGLGVVVQAKIAVNLTQAGSLVSTLAEAPVQQCDPPVVEEAQLISTSITLKLQCL